MDLDRRLQNLKNESGIVSREEKIRQTVGQSKALYFRQEEKRLLTYPEFLWIQLQYTRKRWWMLQAGLLILTSLLMPLIEANYYRIRSMGVIGCLFVVLMIPELWRNKSGDSTQVEAACLYSLRQIYAARITLFGLVDLFLLTWFCLGLGAMGFTLMEVLSHFLLPVTTTAAICFSLLCGKQNWTELSSLTACLGWGSLWWLILMNESLYRRILPAVWMVLLGLAFALLVLAVCRTVRTTNQYWEVEFV